MKKTIKDMINYSVKSVAKKKAISNESFTLRGMKAF